MPIKDPSLKAIRHMLASIDLSDIEEDKEISESEHKAYVTAIFAVWPRLEKDIKELLHAQLMFVANNAETMEQVAFGRGTFNGMDLLLEKWRKAAAEHIPVPKDEVDEHNPLPQL